MLEGKGGKRYDLPFSDNSKPRSGHHSYDSVDELVLAWVCVCICVVQIGFAIGMEKREKRTKPIGKKRHHCKGD